MKEKIFIANIIFTLVIGLIVAAYANYLSMLSEEKYNSPLWPTSENLVISTHPRPIELPIQFMVDENHLHNRPFFEICINNPAKMETGAIYIDIVNENLTSFEEYPIVNIDSLKGECGRINLRHKNCYENDCLVNMNSVANGTRDLTFNFRCTNCKQYSFNKTFSMCLWRESSLECKN